MRPPGIPCTRPAPQGEQESRPCSPAPVTCAHVGLTAILSSPCRCCSRRPSPLFSNPGSSPLGRESQGNDGVPSSSGAAAPMLAPPLLFPGLVDFVSRNLSALLDLVKDRPGSPSITGREFDRLAFLLTANPATFQQQQGATPLHAAVPLLAESKGEPVDSGAVAEYLGRHLALASTSGLTPMGASDSLLRPSPAPAPATAPSEIYGVSRGTVVRGEDSVPSGCLRVTECHDCTVYALAPVQFCDIQGCSDCTLVIGAVARVLRLERCERVQLMTAAGRVLVHTCHDCTLYLGTGRPVYLLGDCRFLQLAPLATKYDLLAAHLRQAGIDPRVNLWDRYVQLVREERTAAPDSPNPTRAALAGRRESGAEGGQIGLAPASLLPPEKLAPFVIPFRGGPGKAAGGAPAMARPAGPLGEDMGAEMGLGSVPGTPAGSGNWGDVLRQEGTFQLPPVRACKRGGLLSRGLTAPSPVGVRGGPGGQDEGGGRAAERGPLGRPAGCQEGRAAGGGSGLLQGVARWHRQDEGGAGDRQAREGGIHVTPPFFRIRPAMVRKSRNARCDVALKMWQPLACMCNYLINFEEYNPFGLLKACSASVCRRKIFRTGTPRFGRF